ncbi:hypothetical protein BGW36DRAFT_306168 [Talaromyces proteolyticus]|uniref:Zn(2)-C6 fungal-type domain-containing protein n=1 Tax=Talaromyces proteolyticus TaxID=1131652 RepID=A0AAD4PT92_9EURO|nr:uncharacterized protein BGW36DRAFT_306168 [Talaromyces proteolyticus]KAH8690456.1 hypothetical protein BGW36DRAFT_306168 [Talaromyces proteolyticus]
MATQLSPSRPELAMREFFGDRKPPDISRKITACVACRKLKIKCHMQDLKPPCARCKKRGLSCTVNRSLQMVLEGDAIWKNAMEQKLVLVQETINKIANRMMLSEVLDAMPKDNEKVGIADESLFPRVEDGDELIDPPTSQPAWEVIMDAKCSPAAIPATCISAVSKQPPPDLPALNSHPSDLISRGTISLSSAERFFSIYHGRLDHFIYRVLIDRDSLSSIRAHSSLLTAAICAVGSLHAASPEYQICYKEFINEYSTQMTSNRHTIDDVRGLCIAAFWLSGMSWALAGAAVRMATELHLHQGVTKSIHRCVNKTPQEKKTCYLRTRLYLLVYVCDHHFSVVHGRPPMTREFMGLSTLRSFLELDSTNEDDVRLVSQVELWSINSRIYDTFGINTDTPIPLSSLSEFRCLGVALESWRTTYSEKFSFNSHVGNYPKIGVGLHFHFAKLYLCTHAFRGASKPDKVTVSPEMDEFADTAVYSASYILRTLVGNQEGRSYLDGLPTYFDTMVAFAVVFLLKMTIKSPIDIRIDKPETMKLLSQVAAVLSDVTSHMHSQHVLSDISISVTKLVGRFQNSTSQSTSNLADNSPVTTFELCQVDGDWLGPEDSTFLGNYDLLFLQDGAFGLEIDQLE